MCLILPNQINLGNNVLYNLLDYGNKYFKEISTKEHVARNSLLIIDDSMNEIIILRQDFDAFEDNKRFYINNKYN